MLTAIFNKMFFIKDLRHHPEILRRGVKRSYSHAAASPAGPHPFPCGAAFARALGYPDDILSTIPDRAVATFVGVSNISLSADIPAGAKILDLGCGAGLDAIIAGRRTGPSGWVTGLDFSQEMLRAAREAAKASELTNLDFICGEAECLPFAAETMDVVLVNGLFNLNPARHELFAEIFRVIKPGGLVFAAELVLTAPLKKRRLRRPDDWFS